MKLPITPILLFLVVTLFTIFSSCKPETIIETEIVTIKDTLVIETTDTVIVAITDTLIIPITDTLFIPDDAGLTSFILVKHAEESPIGNDPILTPEGAERAQRLANVLSEMALDRIYSTNLNRTKQTAVPTSIDQGVDVSIYEGFDHDEVIDDILENVNQGKVLIVGHSNTTPNFLNALTGTADYPDLPEDVFDNLFLVNTKSKGDAEVIHLKY